MRKANIVEKEIIDGIFQYLIVINGISEVGIISEILLKPKEEKIDKLSETAVPQVSVFKRVLRRVSWSKLQIFSLYLTIPIYTNYPPKVGLLYLTRNGGQATQSLPVGLQ